MAWNNWDVTAPIDHFQIKALPGAIRDVESSVKIIVSREHVPPSTGQAGGQHLKGSARVYLDSGHASNDPEGNSLATGADTSDNGRVSVDTANSNTVRVYVATSAGVSTGWQSIRCERVKLAENGDANGFSLSGLATGTQSGYPIHVGQLDTGYFKGVSTGVIQVKTLATYLAASGQDGIVVAYAKAAGDSDTVGGYTPGAFLGDMVQVDSLGATLSLTAVYLAGSDGVVMFHSHDAAGNDVTAYVGATGSVSTIVAAVHNSALSAQRNGLSFVVNKDKYWKIVSGEGLDGEIYWVPIGNGGCVKQ